MVLKKTVEVIEILWEGPYKFKKVKQFDDRQKDFGLYQIYGVHEIYGPCSLLYIGKTSRQTFKKRIAEQKQWLKEDQEYGELQAFLGRLGGVGQITSDELDRLIDVAERLLIYWACPIYNEKGCEDAYVEGISGKVVINLGRKMKLPAEVSSLPNESEKYVEGSRWEVYERNG
jgi:hypothetical protein